MSTEMTNESVFKWISIEGWLAIIGFIGAISISFGVMANNQAAADEKIKNIESEQKEMQSNVSEILVDVSVIKVEQEHLQQDIAESKEDIKAIRRLLESQYGG